MRWRGVHHVEFAVLDYEKFVWTGQLTPRFAGTGTLMAKFLESSVRRIADNLIAACERAEVG
jgi:hypothetical protein